MEGSSQTIAEYSATPTLFARIRLAGRYCFADPLNPLYHVNRRSARRGVVVAVTTALLIVVPAWLILANLPERFLPHLLPWVDDVVALIVVGSYLVPMRLVRAAYRRLIVAGRLEPVLLTRLTNGELIRGIVVPELPKAYPLLILGAGLTLLWPWAIHDYDMTRRFMFFTFFCNILVNHVAIAWIMFGFLVRRTPPRLVTLVMLGLLLLDPFFAMWLGGFLHLGPSWRPLVFSFAWVELLYCFVKGAWACFMIFETRPTFRDSLNS